MALPRNANQVALTSETTRAIADSTALDARVTSAEATLVTVSTHEARIASLETEPPAHGSTHLPGGSDDIPVATELSPGFLPALSGNASEYLDGTGAWSAPASGGGGTDLSYTASTRVLASSTGADATLPLVTSTDAGLAPASGGGTSNFLRADGTWAAPSGGSSDHGTLTGLADDDHLQYVRADGSRANWPVPTATPTANAVPKALAGAQLDSDWIRQTTTCDYRATNTVSPGQCYIANSSTGVALATKTLAANTEYWIPYVAPKSGATLASVRLQVTTLVAGGAVWVGVYLCKSNPSNALWPNFGDFRPVGSPINSANMSTAATGTFTLAITPSFTPGFTYWFCILSSSATHALRAAGTNQVNCNLGWQLPSGTTAPNAITHWTSSRTYVSGLRTGMTGTETYTAGTGAYPAIFMLIA
jgi:hypothetical protein